MNKIKLISPFLALFLLLDCGEILSQKSTITKSNYVFGLNATIESDFFSNKNKFIDLKPAYLNLSNGLSYSCGLSIHKTNKFHKFDFGGSINYRGRHHYFYNSNGYTKKWLKDQYFLLENLTDTIFIARKGSQNKEDIAQITIFGEYIECSIYTEYRFIDMITIKDRMWSPYISLKAGNNWLIGNSIMSNDEYPFLEPFHEPFKVKNSISFAKQTYYLGAGIGLKYKFHSLGLNYKYFNKALMSGHFRYSREHEDYNELFQFDASKYKFYSISLNARILVFNNVFINLEIF